jgi:putative ABC transport system permease protein
METLLQDLRHALRGLAKNLGFSIVAVVTLALGIGANTAIFSVVNGVLLKPLPFPNPSRLISITFVSREHARDVFPLSDADFLDWQAQNRGFEKIAAYCNSHFNLTGASTPQLVRGTWVTADFFSLLGVKPKFGRAFTIEDARPGSPPGVVLSYRFWQERFRSDSDVVGRTLTLDGRNLTIIGVMPPGFVFPGSSSGSLPGRNQLWRILQMAPTRRGPYYLWGLGRLPSGVSADQARSELAAVGARIAQQNPLNNAHLVFRSLPLQRAMVGDVRPALLILLAAVGFVLLIATANVANLHLARAAGRRREMAIRAALGASPFRLTRQLLTESLLVAALGGALGLAGAFVGLRLLLAISPGNLPRLQEIGLDWTVLEFTAGISLFSGIVFGLAPAFQLSRAGQVEAMKAGTRSATAGPGGGQARSLFVVAEVALSLMLVLGAGLLLKSFLRLQDVNPGFPSRNLLTMQVTLPHVRYPKDEQISAFYQRLLERIEVLPGVESAAITMALPPNHMDVTDNFTVEGARIDPGQPPPLADLIFISPAYFKTLGVPLLKGRFFTDADRADAPKVAIINETMAKRFWPGADPIGKRLKTGGPERPKNPWMEIVGVVGDVKYAGLDAVPEPALYQPHQQAAWEAMYVVVRMGKEPASLAPALQNAVWSLDRDLALAGSRTMDQLLFESVEEPRFRMTLMLVFAALALALASVGIYGLMAYAVTQRTQEIGVRLALGALPADVLRLILRQGLLLTLAGIGLGMAGSLALTRLLSSLLFEVSATDPLTFVGVASLLGAIALLACYIPARRAMKVDPLVALRYE